MNIQDVFETKATPKTYDLNHVFLFFLALIFNFELPLKELIMKTILLLTLISSSLFAQEVYWQSLIKVEHPITGARDSTWFGIGNVAEGYNPYLDSLFYGNYDSLQDIRILGFDNLAYDSGVYYSHLPSICADLHRNIRPLNYYNHTLNYVKFHFLIWVDESNFQEEQYAQLILPGHFPK